MVVVVQAGWLVEVIVHRAVIAAFFSDANPSSSTFRKGSLSSSTAVGRRDAGARHLSMNRRAAGSVTLYKAAGFIP